MTRTATPVRRPSAQRRKAWVLPFFALGTGNSIDTTAHGVTLRVAIAVWFVVCLLIGVAWQLLYRRDLADRFMLLSLLFVLGMAGGLLSGSVDTEHVNVFAALTVPSICAGVVLTEHRLRNQDI